MCVHRAALVTLGEVVQLALVNDEHVYEFTVRQALDAGASAVTDDRLPTEPIDHAVVEGLTTSGCAKRMKNAVKRVHP